MATPDLNVWPDELETLGFTKASEAKVLPPEEETEQEAQARELLIRDQTDPRSGLPAPMVDRRRAEFGYNELPDKKTNPILKYLSYYILPMPLMIWAAAIIELIQAIITGVGWEDFVVLMVLQVANGTVGFVEEMNAGNAVAALKAKLTPECYVCRAGVWAKMASRDLVPGDLIELKMGDIVPADAILLDGQPIQVDQSALTGESLPVTLYSGGKAKMGSAIKRGEIKAVVCGTGKYTFFGKAAELLNKVVTQGRFQRVVIKITLSLLAFSLLLVLVIFIFLMVTNNTNVVHSTSTYHQESRGLEAISTSVVLLVASIPIAIEVVCTTTMAMGSRKLAAQKVIVARLSAIEELAGMSILCSDKTGTLTQNKLTLNDPILFAEISPDDLVFFGALSSKRVGTLDAVDSCMIQGLKPEYKDRLETYTELDFVPFNPTDKRTIATVQDTSGRVFQVAKGAAQVILNMAYNADEIRNQVESAMKELADRGFRSLNVAVSYTAPGEPPKWELLGMLSVYDPPRIDAKETIAKARENLIEVKMITGDHTAIAVETCRMLGLGTNVLGASVFEGNNYMRLGTSLEDVILHANGFAEVYPEHKFKIVEVLRNMGYVVGMTGDGVNDAPALKRADIGIAVEGATDAAKAAAAIVLVEPGLGVIIDAIFRSRKIFHRMRSYCIYRVACTCQLLVFFFFAILTASPSSSHFYGKTYGPAGCQIDHAGVFTLPVIALIIITILNDGTILTIAYDRVVPERKPQQWNLKEVTVVAGVLGAIGCLSSLIFLVAVMGARGSDFIARAASPGKRPVNSDPSCQGAASLVRYVSYGETQTMVYLQISLAGFFTLFAARCRQWFFLRRPSIILFTAFVCATVASTLLALWWPVPPQSVKELNMAYINNAYGALFTWIWVIIWFLGQDAAKVVTYFVLDKIHFEDEAEVNRRIALAQITAAIATDNRAQRVAGTTAEGSFRLAKDGSLKMVPTGNPPPPQFTPAIPTRAGSLKDVPGAASGAPSAEVRALTDRMGRLERVVEDMRGILAQLLANQAASTASAAAPTAAVPEPVALEPPAPI